MSYPAFLVEYLGAPRNHHAIFLQLDERTESGYIFHVTGDIQSGMSYEVKKARKPELSHSFVQKTFIGWVAAENYDYINEICSAVAPPKKQFQGGRRLYPREPLRRCQEWTQEAIRALEYNGILYN